MYSKIILNIFICSILILNNFHHQYLDKKENVTIFTGKTMGTYWQVKIPNLKNKIYIKTLIEKCLYEDEKMLSSWEKNSLVSKFNKLKKNQLQIINKNFYHIISSAMKINKKTNGKLDITISRLINIWGFGIKKKPTSFPSSKTIKKNLSLSGTQHLKLIKNFFGFYLTKDIDDIEINLSTFGEGFAVDHLSYTLKKNGINNYTISVGGTVLVKLKKYEEKPKIIAIQKPIDQKKSIHLLIYLKNNAISTAGTYRNYYYLKKHRISHLINANTGRPITHNLVSVSVISLTALEADSWDTGLLILGFKKAKKLALKEELAVCLITKEKNVFSTWTSPKFQNFLVH
ncbi:FAD:protein FMN transferase ApbE [Buchnera aphidicola (Brachycaudus cardui)]|uniref:FAD:protein FMN transferase n=1 Tax=Buchnera aphidicola (Brachycaudus cardui) TaxID=557993 RepID=A0A4D6XUC4_9GAMM|nr:FAD:protein FMN transferase [Buchnera aphidicola]QCI20373.1 FAD:protein FMN transferase ApbE [Buchnera aphidicola (Brachycaudus cardui)]